MTPVLRVHLVLKVYADKFEELGYNLRFLREADAKDLEQDLKEMSVNLGVQIHGVMHPILQLLESLYYGRCTRRV